MAALDVGRVCMKIAGREAGKYCVVLKKMDNTFVLVTGPKQLTGVKRRRCNVEHLEPTQYSLKIAAESADPAVIKAYDAIGLTKKLSLRLPSPEVMKEIEKRVEEIPKKVKRPKEEKKPEKPKKEEKPPEKPKEEKPKKKGITIKFKIPTLRKKKPKEEEKVAKKPEEKKVEKKKPVKKPKKKVAKKLTKKKVTKKPKKAVKKAKKKK